jgi:hypothetical protein
VLDESFITTFGFAVVSDRPVDSPDGKNVIEAKPVDDDPEIIDEIGLITRLLETVADDTPIEVPFSLMRVLIVLFGMDEIPIDDDWLKIM